MRATPSVYNQWAVLPARDGMPVALVQLLHSFRKPLREDVACSRQLLVVSLILGLACELICTQELVWAKPQHTRRAACPAKHSPGHTHTR